MIDGTKWTNNDPGAYGILDIAIDRFDRVWVIGEEAPCKLCMFDGKGWKYYYPKNEQDFPEAPYYSSYSKLVTDDKGSVWLLPPRIHSIEYGVFQISGDFPMFTLTEWYMLSFSDTGVFLMLIINLVILWLILAMPSWRNIGGGIISGLLVCILGVIFFHANALSVGNPGLFVAVGSIIGGLVGRSKEKSGKAGAEKTGVISGLIIVFAIWLLLTVCYTFMPKG